MRECKVERRSEPKPPIPSRPGTLPLIAAYLVWAFLVIFPSFPVAAGEDLSGRLLVATTQIGDPRFAKAVIYVLQHDQSGAMGLVINRLVTRWSYKKLLNEMGEDSTGATTGTLDVFYGGPVEMQRGFVLHSLDYKDGGTQAISDFSGLTTSREIVRAIAEGRGPQRFLFILGYAGWGPGQLEEEINRQAWISVDADELLVLGDDHGEKWRIATAKRGIDL